MADNTLIEWTDHTFNPWIGCTKVSAGCDHCYAETWDARGLSGGARRWGPHAERTRTSAANWNKPRAWDKAAKAAGKRARVFCASLADVFDNHDSIDHGTRAGLWRLIAETPNLDWQLLTKRPQNIVNYLPDQYGLPAWGNGWPNVWLGTTAENQTEADRRIPHLLSTPAAVRFISAEPLLGPVDLAKISTMRFPRAERLNALTGEISGILGDPAGRVEKIDWVICGGESGQNARPMHPQWARDLRDQCAAAGTAYFFKQWGEWGPADHLGEEVDGARFGCFNDAGQWVQPVSQDVAGRSRFTMFRLGKKQNGALLDGREHKDFPNG